MIPIPGGANWREGSFGNAGAGPEPDAYFEWARATSFAYHGRQVQWLPVLAQLNGTSAQTFARLVEQMQCLAVARQGWAADVQVPPFFATRPQRLRRDTQAISLLMTRSLLEQVYEGRQSQLASMIRRINIGRHGQPGNPTAMSLPGPFKPGPGEGPPQLVTAVIDDAIAFAHDRLRSSNGSTRVEYLWQQGSALGWPIAPGRELSKRAAGSGLDALALQATHNGLIDEDEVYRLAGVTDARYPGPQTLAARFAHGAHVADLACCDGPPPLPGQRPVVGVQLPGDVVADVSGASLRPQVFSGLVYAMYRAETIEQSFGTGSLPLLANISYGVFAGPHDGSDIFEEAVDDLLDACDPKAARFHVLLPSGNSHLSRCHACFDLAPGATQTLPWRVLPDDHTPGSLQIRLPPLAQGVTIRLRLPDGSASQTLSSGSVTALGTPGAARALVFYPPTPSPRRVMLIIYIAPTAAIAGGVPLAPAGLWQITLQQQGGPRIDSIHAWVQRDGHSPGFPRRGQQSYFDDPAYARFDAGGRAIENDAHPLTAASVVHRAGSQNALATGRRPIVVGAFRRSDGAASSYSAGGALPPPGRGDLSPNGPEAMLPGDDSPSHVGVLGAGTRSGSCVAMNGTSVATPLALRALVREIVAGRAAGRKELFALAAAFPPNPQPPWPRPKPSVVRGGGGRLDEPSTRRPR